MPVTIATPTILKDPGFLLWAPLLSSEPANTVVGSVFTDTWPVAWINLGATEDGSKFKYESKVEPISVAEFFDPIQYSTTERSGSFAFNLTNYTLQNLKRVFNGGTLTTVSGSGTTLLSKYTPPAPGTEVRAMIGWESLDATTRVICYQTLQGGAMETEFKKAPAKAVIPAEFMFEVPASTIPFAIWSAGTARVGV